MVYQDDDLTPYVLEDKDLKILRSVVTGSTVEGKSAQLLVRTGPIILVSSGVVYSDIPAEVVLFSPGNKTITRPRPTERLPTLAASLMVVDPQPVGWPSKYGDWDVHQPNGEVLPDDRWSFNIHNRLAASALAMEMLKHGYDFQVTCLTMPEGEAISWQFTLDSEVFQHVLTHCQELIGGPTRVSKG